MHTTTPMSRPPATIGNAMLFEGSAVSIPIISVALGCDVMRRIAWSFFDRATNGIAGDWFSESILIGMKESP